MIRIEIGRQDLINRIHAKSASWIARALARTKQYELTNDYTGGADFWGEIKGVYIDLHHEKCAYCETKLQGSVLASKVHEVEHFRPKSSVKAWPDRARPYWREFPSTIHTGSGSEKGYFLLAYHPFNYAIACTRCNSTLKSNYFPIRGRRAPALADPSEDATEDPLLIYPLSDLAADPAALITFDGVLAVPKYQDGSDYERAATTIWFFQLNHEDLTSRRADMLVPMWNTLEQARMAHEPEDRALALSDINHVCSPAGQFSSCMSAFRDLYQADRSAARERYLCARQLQKNTL